ncbi:MAG: type IV pilin protein [Proteobacteria bacterium]|nr:type IV pilin protein [Pseudomonadota bacterium]
MRARTQAGRAAGFTLIELMITVVVVAILAAIAIPSYESYVEKSRRTDAKTALLDLATREQRYYSVTNTFTASAQDLGYGTAFPVTVGSGYYSVNVLAPAGANPPTFTITATPIGSQTADTQCASFTVDNTGKQSALDSSNGDSTATCWGQ